MDRSERKAAVSAYKERKAMAGVYAVRCAATDAQWVGLRPIFPRSGGAAVCAAPGRRDDRALQSAWKRMRLKASPSGSSKGSTRPTALRGKRALKARAARARDLGRRRELAPGFALALTRTIGFEQKTPKKKPLFEARSRR